MSGAATGGVGLGKMAAVVSCVSLVSFAYAAPSVCQVASAFELFPFFLKAADSHCLTCYVLHALRASLARLDPSCTLPGAASQPSRGASDEDALQKALTERLYMLKVLAQLAGLVTFWPYQDLKDTAFEFRPYIDIIECIGRARHQRTLVRALSLCLYGGTYLCRLEGPLLANVRGCESTSSVRDRWDLTHALFLCG